MTAETLKAYIEQALKVLSIIASLTTTKIDDMAVEALTALSKSDALLALVAGWLTDGDVSVPAEMQAEWDSIQPALTPVRKIVEAHKA